MMKRRVKFDNYSMWREKRHGYDWYHWCVFVDEPDTTLKQITRVEYELHPTFPDPIQVIDKRETRFALFSSGWGEFEISIRIYFTDGTTGEESYDLRLGEDNWPLGNRPQDFPNENVQKVYETVSDPGHKWIKLSYISASTGLPTDQVKGILGQLEQQHLVRQSQAPSLDNQELWGSTSAVGLPPWWIKPVGS